MVFKDEEMMNKQQVQEFFRTAANVIRDTLWVFAFPVLMLGVVKVAFYMKVGGMESPEAFDLMLSTLPLWMGWVAWATCCGVVLFGETEKRRVAICALIGLGTCGLFLIQKDQPNDGIHPTTNGRSVYLSGAACTIDANLDEMTPEQMRIDFEECIVLFKEDVKKGYPVTVFTTIGHWFKYKKLPVTSRYFPAEAAKEYAAENLN